MMFTIPSFEQAARSRVCTTLQAVLCFGVVVGFWIVPVRASTEAVIPAGQDEVLARMLASGEILPGSCRLRRGGAEGGVIRAWYQCSDGEAAIELHHPDALVDASALSERFAIVSRGSSPPEFLRALVARVRHHEQSFEWRILRDQTDTQWRAVVRVNAVLFLVLSALCLLVMLARRLSKLGIADLAESNSFTPAKETVGKAGRNDVTPAKAGVQSQLEGGNAGFPALDPGFRRDDEQVETRLRRKSVSFVGMTTGDVRALLQRGVGPWGEIVFLAVLTLLAACLRFFVAVPNLFDHGGVPYMRLLRGTNGYWGTAQLYAAFYALTAADLEHAILLNRLVGVLTIPLVYAMCRCLLPQSRLWAVVSAFLFAVHPLHILFSASDALAVPANFLAATGYAFFGAAVEEARRRGSDSASVGLACLYFLAGGTALCLLTQVRQEHLVFLIPAVAFVACQRRHLSLPVLAPGLALAMVLLSFYAQAAATTGGRYQAVWPSLQAWCEEAIRNPVLGLPALLFGSLAVGVYLGLWRGVLALLAWLPAIMLPASIALGGHHATRVYANWLIWLLPIAAFGFSLLLISPRRIARLLGAAAVCAMALHPLVVKEVFSTQYLEILEHQSFRSLLENLPAEVRYVVVPDDDLEGIDSTLEVFNKYARILDASPAGRRGVRLRKLSGLLDLPADSTCAPGPCLFFFGLPCQGEGLTSPVGKACANFLQRGHNTSWREDSLVGASFLHCSIYSGAWRERQCAPTIRSHQFVAYRSAE